MNIAVIGSGIAGLSAAWLLARDHAITLYEAGDRLGGHAHTVDVTLDGVTAPVDTGFLVFNKRTYPLLTTLFDHLAVPCTASDMSFSVRLEEERLTWAGTSVTTLFAQPRNLLRPRFWRMLGEILRFNRLARAAAAGSRTEEVTLGGFLDRHGFGAELRDWYLLPMAGAIWSSPPRQMLDYPLQAFVSFCHNHGLLQITDRPQWYTVTGGSREYVRRLAAPLDEVRLGEPVSHVGRDLSGVDVASDHGPARRYDHVVLACHPDQALALLDDPSVAERDLLGAFRYQPNRAVLHCDPSVLPAERHAWAAWNYRAGSARHGDAPVGVSYWINRLQSLPFERPVIVTLNPQQPIDPATVHGEYHYDHPLFDFGALRAQQALGRIQGQRRTSFCGAWTGHGFHEDGLRSGLEVAARLGSRAPWDARERAA